MYNKEKIKKEATMKTNVSFDLPDSNLRIGFLEAFDISVKPSSDKYIQIINDDIQEMLSPSLSCTSCVPLVEVHGNIQTEFL